MFFLFGRARAQANQRLVDRLHDDIVAAVRRPVFYLDYGVADTFEGRFEIMSVLAGLVLRRLNAAEAPGPNVAQDLVDTIFRKLDPGLRELGVGDLGVPKRMKKLAEAFLGRCTAYDAGLRGGPDDLAAAISRNVYGGRDPGRRLARYAETTAQRFDTASLDDLLVRSLPFPEPEAVA